MRRIVVGVALTGLACGGGPPPAVIAPPPPVPAPVTVAPTAPEVAASAPQAGWLVWHGPDAKTAWITPDGKVRAVRDGIVVSGGDVLYRWVEEEAQIPATDCACFEQDLGDCTIVAAPIEVAALVGFAEPAARWEVAPAIEADTPDGAPRQTVELTSTFDRYATIEVRESHEDCSGETRRESIQSDLDLFDEQDAYLYAAEDTEALVEEHRPAFGSALPPSCQAAGDVQPTLVAVDPTWGKDGGMRVGLRFTAQIPEGICSYGEWESALVDAKVDAQRIPEGLKPYEQLPEPIRSYWGTLPEGRGGWTSVPPQYERQHWLTFGYGTADGAPPAAFLAWGERNGDIETTWFAFDGSPRATRPGIVSTDGKRLLQWLPETKGWKDLESGAAVPLPELAPNAILSVLGSAGPHFVVRVDSPTADTKLYEPVGAAPSDWIDFDWTATLPAVLRDQERTGRTIEGWSAVPASEENRMYGLFDAPSVMPALPGAP